MAVTRGVLISLIAGLLSACSAVDPAPPRSERRYRKELAGTRDLKDLIPLILRTSDDDFLFEPSLLRMIELSCGAPARDEVDAFLDRAEARLRQILKEQPPQSAEKLFLALKGLWLDLDLHFRSPESPEEGRPRLPGDVSLLPLARRSEGRCGSFSQFFLCLAERLELPLSYVRLPNHAFLRVHGKGRAVNFETNLPVWTCDRTDDFYLERYGGPGSPMDGHPFYLRSLTKRQAALDEISDEIAALWITEGRYGEILEMCDAAEPAMGQDAFLERRLSALYRTGYDRVRGALKDAKKLRESLLLAERLQRLSPNQAGYSLLMLDGYYQHLKDVPKGREIAEEILRNPRMPARLRQRALAVLKDQAPR